jgi:hypothetical protein
MKTFLLFLITLLLCSCFNSFSDDLADQSTELVLKEWVSEIDSKSDPEEEELTIVGTVDGYIHAIDSQNQKKWSTSTGGSMISSHQNPSFNSKVQRDYSIIPSLDGSLLVHNAGGMRKTSVKARMLAEKAPFMSVDGELVFTGNRKSKVIGVDVDSGEITHEINIDGESPPAIQSNVLGEKSPLWIGRIDYTVRAFDGTSGAEQFNLSYTEIRPLSHSRLSAHENAIMSNHKLELPSVKGLVSKESKLPRLTRAASTSKALPNDHDQVIAIDASGESMYHAVHVDSPAMSAFRIKRGLDHSGFDVEPMRVSNKGLLPRTDDNLSDDEVIEIRTSIDGGIYALKTDPYEADDDHDNSGIEIDHGIRLHDMDSQMKRPDVNRFSSSRITSSLHLHSKQPLRGSLPLPPRTGSSQSTHATSDKTSNPSPCIFYPNTFMSTHEIDELTQKLLEDSKDYETAMCLVGHHRLIPGQVNDLPFLPPNQFDLPIPVPPQPSFLSKIIKRNQNAVYTLLILLCLLILINLDRIKKYVKVVLLSMLSEGNLSSKDSDMRVSTISSDYSESIDENGKKIIRVGALQVHEKILGYGSQGTVVFLGSLNGRPVAVKRMLSQFSRVADREMSLLIRSDGHPNVVRYFLKEEKGDFIYLALQLCCMSLR